jgi:hypothetical protein
MNILNSDQCVNSAELVILALNSGILMKLANSDNDQQGSGNQLKKEPLSKRLKIWGKGHEQRSEGMAGGLGIGIHGGILEEAFNFGARTSP